MEIVWLEDDRCSDPLHVGGKAASLGRLAAAHRVPAAFALTTAAFQRWGALRLEPDPDLPLDLLDAISAAYERLAERCGVAEPPVAVRSSGVDEDGSDASFAGQHDTFLNVIGAEAVAGSVVRCWASLGSEVALSYREQSGLDVEGAQMAVVVQHLVAADVSGVVFSANPLTGARDEAMLNASWGLGESVVSGTVTPDTFSVDKASGALLSQDIAKKQRMTVRVDGGTREVDVPRVLQETSTLSEEQAASVAALASLLEETTGAPVDVEWAIQGDELYLLQCRPITTLG